MSEDLRRDQVSRSRQTEYSTLKRVDELSISVNNIKDEKEILQNSFQRIVSLLTGNLCTYRTWHRLPQILV